MARVFNELVGLLLTSGVLTVRVRVRVRVRDARAGSWCCLASISADAVGTPPREVRRQKKAHNREQNFSVNTRNRSNPYPGTRSGLFHPRISRQVFPTAPGACQVTTNRTHAFPRGKVDFFFICDLFHHNFTILWWYSLIGYLLLHS